VIILTAALCLRGTKRQFQIGALAMAVRLETVRLTGAALDLGDVAGLRHACTGTQRALR